jgi:hypothetical protein
VSCFRLFLKVWEDGTIKVTLPLMMSELFMDSVHLVSWLPLHCHHEVPERVLVESI